MNSPIFINKIFKFKTSVQFSNITEMHLKFSIMFEPFHLKSLIQNINNVQQQKFINKILQSFQLMKV